jgi:dihydroneopterin aldolase
MSDAFAGLDRIAVHGITAYGRHGVLPQERSMGQVFGVDVTLGVNTAQAAAADDLDLTVNYGTIALSVADLIGGEPFDLIETLADRIAGMCLAHDRVRVVEVTVHKPHAPIPLPFNDVALTIVRSKT